MIKLRKASKGLGQMIKGQTHNPSSSQVVIDRIIYCQPLLTLLQATTKKAT